MQLHHQSEPQVTLITVFTDGTYTSQTMDLHDYEAHLLTMAEERASQKAAISAQIALNREAITAARAALRLKLNQSAAGLIIEPDGDDLDDLDDEADIADLDEP
jgi:hypothetical protein